MKKIIICLCLAVMICLLAFPVSAATEGNFKYTITDGKATVTQYAGSGDVQIPATLDGCPVTAIGNWAFEFCSGVTSVTMPDSVTTIGERAFYDCTSLESVIIGDSVTIIGYAAFAYCDNLTSVVIGDSVTSIGDGAFAYCDSLSDVYYTGTARQWQQISIGYYNFELSSATVHYNYTPEE